MPEFHLFILESIGTQELILVGLVALIVFGPRKLPQMARKFGSMLTEFRKVSNEFRSTWEREASLGEDLMGSDSNTISRTEPKQIKDTEDTNAANGNTGADTPKELTAAGSSAIPEIREMSREEFEKIRIPDRKDSAAALDPDLSVEEADPSDSSDKRNWL